MENEQIKVGDYPYNMLLAVGGRKLSELPLRLTKDIQAGIMYCTLQN